MERKNLSQHELDILNKKLNILLKNPKKNFYEINSIYQKLVTEYFYIKKISKEFN